MCLMLRGYCPMIDGPGILPYLILRGTCTIEAHLTPGGIVLNLMFEGTCTKFHDTRHL